MSLPPLNLTGGAAAPSSAYGAPVTVGGLNVQQPAAWSSLLPLAVLGVVVVLLIKRR